LGYLLGLWTVTHKIAEAPAPASGLSAISPQIVGFAQRDHRRPGTGLGDGLAVGATVGVGVGVVVGVGVGVGVGFTPTCRAV
jgi:hypothetical protein